MRLGKMFSVNMMPGRKIKTEALLQRYSGGISRPFFPVSVMPLLFVISYRIDTAFY